MIWQEWFNASSSAKKPKVWISPRTPANWANASGENVSKQAWADWIKHQTMLVNENRLNLADARARQYLARQMEQHFFGGGADAVQGYVPPSA